MFVNHGVLHDNQKEGLVQLCNLCTNKEFSGKVAFDMIPSACTRLRQRLNKALLETLAQDRNRTV